MAPEHWFFRRKAGEVTQMRVCDPLADLSTGDGIKEEGTQGYPGSLTYTWLLNTEYTFHIGPCVPVCVHMWSP